MKGSKQQYYFYIKGLHCASCVYNTEKALKKIRGVKKAMVNLIDGRAMVESIIKINQSEISKKINSLGYQAIFDHQEIEEKKLDEMKTKEMKKLKFKVILGLIFSFFLLLGTFPKLMDFSPLIFQDRYFQLFLATITQFYLGHRFYYSGLSFLRTKKANMETLIIVGTTAAYFYSLVAVLFLKDIEPYFDVSVVIISFVLLGRYLEEKAKMKTGEAIKKLLELTPKEATILVKS